MQENTNKTVADIKNDAVNRIAEEKQSSVRYYIQNKLEKMEATEKEIAKLQKKISDAQINLKTLESMTVAEAYEEINKTSDNNVLCTNSNMVWYSVGNGSTTL